MEVITHLAGTHCLLRKEVYTEKLGRGYCSRRIQREFNRFGTVTDTLQGKSQVTFINIALFTIQIVLKQFFQS